MPCSGHLWKEEELNAMYIDNPVKLLKKVRDLTLMAVNDEQYMVIACDSDGGIGSKPYDAVKVPEEVLGQFAVRVPLFEIVSCGATPFMVIDCLAVEMNPSGEKILAEIKQYVREAGITDDIQFTGSSEENVPTVQTGIGVTILGLADQKGFPVGASRGEDQVVCVGIPKSGPDYDIHPDDPDIVTLRELIKLRKSAAVHDLLPAGSKGVQYEAEELARSAGKVFVDHQDLSLDLKQSAGPATCILLTCGENDLHIIKKLVQSPVTVIGELKEPDL